VKGSDDGEIPAGSIMLIDPCFVTESMLKHSGSICRIESAEAGAHPIAEPTVPVADFFRR